MSVNSGDQANREGIEWLRVVLAVVTIVALALVYIFWRPPLNNMLGQLVISCIPAAIVVLIAVPIIYFVSP